MDDKLYAILVFYPLLLFCLSFHESAHAWMANKLGDDTAKLLGRITLNPIPHMDPIGTVFLPLLSLLTGTALFGWGKPVPVNPYHFKDPRRGSLWVALVGPVSNFLLAALFAGAFRLVAIYIPNPDPFLKFCYTAVVLNLVLAFFNLIPAFPLDGGSVLRGLLPGRWVPAYDAFSRYSIFILLFLFISGLLRFVLIPVSLTADLLLP